MKLHINAGHLNLLKEFRLLYARTQEEIKP